MDRQYIQKVRRTDRIATRIITVGGLLIIASVIAILLLIVKVALPIFLPARADIIHRVQLPQGEKAAIIAVGVGDYQEAGFTLDRQGDFTFYNLADGRIMLTHSASASPGRRVRALDNYRNTMYTILWDDGGITLSQVGYRLLFDKQGRRTVQPFVETIRSQPPDDLPEQPVMAASRLADDGRFTKVLLLPDNRLAVSRQVTTTDIFDNEVSETSSFLIDETIPGKITAFSLDEQGSTLYAGTDTGSLLRWDLADKDKPVRTDNVVAIGGKKAVTSLALVFGDVSVAVGGEDGSLTTWMQVWSGAGENKTKKLRKIHVLHPHASPVTAITASRRTKSLTSLDQDGSVHFDNMTSENHLLNINASLSRFGLAARDNSLIGLDRRQALVVWNIDIQHPEINLKTLFGKVWYESYNKPEYVWQSSAGNDDFEPKYSIVPLLFGTIKGTLYAMIFAMPLAIFGAVYTSQFTTPAYKRSIKPAIEIMASVPSVVIGFLIALWLAPIVENAVLAVLLNLVMVPVVFVLFMSLIKPLCENPLIQNKIKGYEFLMLVPIIFLAGAASVLLAPSVESFLFQGNFRQWLYDALGMRYDQRNSIIIAFGLGIAVIPIIFSITEDAISNIPPSLAAASLALGASRWQTIWRVILPSASPGIFAAVMIGFGRAVGETMIVLMATGNTPIMDWSIFNGMRTLSANIAVEIPEAPFGGTLYRVLFLCATILFLLTFILNTGAELVRERLRKKYGRY